MATFKVNDRVRFRMPNSEYVTTGTVLEVDDGGAYEYDMLRIKPDSYTIGFDPEKDWISARNCQAVST